MKLKKAALVILLALNSGLPVMADDTASSNTTNGTASNSTNATTSTDPKVLEGQIKADSINLETHLKELTNSLHHLKRAAFDIFCETQRQDDVVAVQPDVIGPIILPAIPNPSGVLSMGTLPPRKNWLDYFMNQVGQLLPMVDSEINSIVMPQEISDQGKQDLVQIRELARGLNPLAVNLDKVTSVTDLKNDDIAKSAVAFQEQVTSLEKMVKDLSKQAKLEEKKAAKDLKDLERKKSN